MKRTIAGAMLALAMSLAPATALAAGAGGVTGPAFYVDGELYRTVGTPTNLTRTGAPDHSFDTIYAFVDGEQTNVAEAKPGDRDYNGGRWMVQGVTFDDYDDALAAGDANGNGVLDSAEEVEAAIDAGSAEIIGELTRFVCPVIRIP
jgi:hypothetical protein